MDTELSNDQIFELQRQVANGLIGKLIATGGRDSVGTVIGVIRGRIVTSGDSLAILWKNAKFTWEFDGMLILRSVYDIMLQGLCIMAYPQRREERTQRYRDFRHIEKMGEVDLIDSNETESARNLRDSERRADVEPEIIANFERVKGRFTTTKKRGKEKLHRTWYEGIGQGHGKGTLRYLAREVGYEQEYEMMQKFLSGVVHASPLTLERRPFVNDFFLIDWCWRFVFRILAVEAEHLKVELSEDETGLIDLAQKSVL